jgi:hypothetical protein
MPCEILKIHMKPVNFFDKASLLSTKRICLAGGSVRVFSLSEDMSKGLYPYA